MAPSAASLQEARAHLEGILRTDARERIVAEFSRSKSFDRAARRLRDAFRSHRFDVTGLSLPSPRWISRFDHLTRHDGFHVLNDWDGQRDRFNEEIIPTEVAIFAERFHRPTDHQASRVSLAIVLDYYFLHLIALLALRSWDEGDPNANLGAAAGLLEDLQGPKGSGQRMAQRVETLILIATSHFEPDITAYDRLLARVRRLDTSHRRRMAMIHARILGCHLRFGLEVTCAGDLKALREDNQPDYPWLCEALATLCENYADEADRTDRLRLAESIFLGLMPDPDSFVGGYEASALEPHRERRERIRESFHAHRRELFADFETLRPKEGRYSPIAFTFNFPHNLIKGSVVDAVLRGSPWRVSLDDLMTASPDEAPADEPRMKLATTLMRYALASPDTIRGRPHPAIVYHEAAGQTAFDRAFERLRSF